MTLDRRFVRPIGVLCIFASDPMIEAGIMAAGSFVHEGDYFRLVVSGLSIFAAVLLLVGGIALCFQRAAGGTIATVAAKLSVPVSLFSAVIGLMGSHALMYGAGYPMVIVLLLRRATPSNGLPAASDHSAAKTDARDNDLQLRTAIA